MAWQLNRRSKGHDLTRRASWTIGGLAAAVLMLTADYQIYDNNFYALAESTALRAGDHPYRDFYEWGVPLQAALSLAMQSLLGHRLLSEFILVWTLMIAGVVMAFQIALRLSHSVAASVLTMLIAVFNLAATPTVHNSKLVIYPAAILLTWRYIERPHWRRSAAMGLIAAVAFFLRHDHGVYVGAGILLAFVLARGVDPTSRALRATLGELAMCGLASAILVVPWALVVERNEGLLNYIEARAFINDKWAVGRSVFLSVLDMNPIRALTPDASALASADADLLDWLPARSNAQTWLQQVSILTTFALLATAVVDWRRAWRRGRSPSLDARRMLLAGSLVALVEHRLFRETGYFVLVAPLIAAFGARLIVGPAGAEGDRPQPRRPEGLRRWRYLGARGVAVATLIVTTLAVAGFVRESNILEVDFLVGRLPRTFGRLAASPPIDGLVAADAAVSLDRAEWMAKGYGDRSDLMVRYMHECVADGDRVLVSGQTPYQISYYVGRPIAGGHLYWHDKWRSDPAREHQSLELLKRQSVPFAFSTHDPVLNDLRAYPRIHEYVQANYREIDGSEGHLLVDTRRRPTGSFGKVGLPCFR